MVDLSGREQCDIIADGINIIQGGGEVVVVFVGDGAEPGAVGEADLETDELINMLYGSNMVKVKLNRLEYKARVLFFAISAFWELVCVLYALIFPELSIVKYYRSKADSERSQTAIAYLVSAGI